MFLLKLQCERSIFLRLTSILIGLFGAILVTVFVLLLRMVRKYERHSLKIVTLGELLQFIYILFYLLQIRTLVLQQFAIYVVAYVELTLSIIILIFGLIALIFKVWSEVTIYVISFVVLSCLWFIVIYLLPESDIPRAIPWFYSN